jgi:hypothetical protein
LKKRALEAVKKQEAEEVAKKTQAVEDKKNALKQEIQDLKRRDQIQNFTRFAIARGCHKKCSKTPQGEKIIEEYANFVIDNPDFEEKVLAAHESQCPGHMKKRYKSHQQGNDPME